MSKNLFLPPAPQPLRLYTLAGLPVAIPPVFRAAQSYEISAWLYAAFSPNGSNTACALAFDGANVLNVSNATGRILQCENDGIGTLHLFRLTARRKPGATGAIPANTIVAKVEPVFAVVADPATDVFTLADHGFNNGDVLQVGGTPPTGLSAATDYVVRDRTRDTFKLTATLGGSAVNISDAGTAVTVLPRPVEIARLNVQAAASGDTEPLCDEVHLEFQAGARHWSDGANPLRFEYSVSDTDLEIVVEAAGQA